jgi:uncharacterized membrane protein YqjE
VEESEQNSGRGLLSQLRAIANTCLSTLQTRGEIFLLELEEEKTHVTELLIWAIAAGLLSLMFLGMLTVFIVMLFPEDLRVWAIGGFCLLYLLGAVLALLNLRSILKGAAPPFSATVNEIKKDRAWLESSK